MMKLFLVTICILFLVWGQLFLVQEHVYAATTNQVPQTVINPGSFLYPVKRAAEKILYFIQFSQTAKFNYQKDLLQTRLAELSDVAQNKSLGQIETSSQRFAYQAGILSDFIVSNQLKKEGNVLLSLFSKDAAILAKLRDLYPANSSYWLLLQQDIDTLMLNSEKIRNLTKN